MGGDAGDRVVAGRYRLAERLGSGGMGAVWAARDEVLRREVALKEVWPQGPPGDERHDLVERTRREARAAAAVASPSVLTVHDVVEDGERTWIVMERLPPRTLADVIAEEGPLDPADAAAVGLAVLDALDAAHEVGVLHRDVKPGNVMWSARGRVVLADFGIAQAPDDTAMTQTGVVLGSPAYLSPERARGGRASPASDLWALGALLFAAVEGRPPFDGSSPLATVNSVVADPVPATTRAGPLTEVVAGLLRKDPDERMTSREARPHLVRALRERRDPTLVGRLTSTGALSAGPSAPSAPAEPPGRSEPPGPAAASPAPVAAAASTPPDGVAAAAPAGGPGTDGPTPLRTPVDAAARPPAPTRGAGPAPAPAEPRRRRRTVLVLGVLAVLAALAVAVGLLSSGGGEADRAGSSPSASAQPGGSSAPSDPGTSPSGEQPTPSAPATTSEPPSPTAAPESGGGAAVPEGLQPYTDQTGFSVAVPAGWAPERDGSQVRFRDPASSRYLLVDQTDDPAPDALVDWQEYEPSLRERFAGYERVRLERIQVEGFEDAADLEFTYDSGGGRTHVVDRNLLVDDFQAYALYWSAPDSTWAQDEDLFTAVAGTFTPAR